MAKYRKLRIVEQAIPKRELFKKRKFNVFVFGLPRSGTSMMTGIIELLGVKIISTSDTEEELKKRNENERKRYGDKYHMNPKFFEITKNVWEHYLKIMGTPYSGCKMIIPVSKERMQVVNFNPGAKVIQMWRDPEEIRQSQQASYKGNRGITEEEAEFERAKIRTLLTNQKMQLEKLGIETIGVQYRDVLKDPETQIKRIAKFINAPKDIRDAVNWVDPKKNRFKKEEIIENI